jgi:hypothetical protein
MDPLTIKGVERDEHDSTGQSFIMHFSRPLTYFEQVVLPQTLSTHFLPTISRGATGVTVRQAKLEFFEDPQLKDKLKQLVANPNWTPSRCKTSTTGGLPKPRSGPRTSGSAPPRSTGTDR